MKWRCVWVSILALLGAQAHGQTSIDKGDWLIRVGGSYIDPSSSGINLSGTITDPGTGDPLTVNGKLTADGDASVTFNATYMATRNVGIELLLALPFRHNLEFEGEKVGSTRLIPPTISVQWHQPIGRAVPYVGLGINFTEFFNETLLNSRDILSISDSRGLAAQIGFDFVLAERWLLNGEIRYISVTPDVKIEGNKVGTIDIDPWVFGLNLGFRFN